MGTSVGSIPIAVAVIVATIAAVTDVWRFKVYNLVTFPVFFAGLAYHAYMEGWTGLAMSLGGAAFGLAVLLLPYLMGGLGAGDVKFVMAIGAWLGVKQLIPMVLLGCIATGVYASVLAVRTGGWRGAWMSFQLLFFRFRSLGRVFAGDDSMENIHTWTQSDERRRRLIPFTAMMAVGLALALALMYWVARTSAAGAP